MRVGRNAGTPHFEKRSIYDLSQDTEHGGDELLTLATAGTPRFTKPEELTSI